MGGIGNYMAQIAMNVVCLGYTYSNPATTTPFGLPIAFLAMAGDPNTTVIDPTTGAWVSGGEELSRTNGYSPRFWPFYSAGSTAPVLNNYTANSTDIDWNAATGDWTPGWDHIALAGYGVTGDAPSISHDFICLWSFSVSPTRNILNTQHQIDPKATLLAGFPNYIGTVFGNQILNATFGAGNIVPPRTPVLVPYHGNPLFGGSELNTNGASRIAIPTFTTTGIIGTNSTAATWGSSSGTWVDECDYLGLVDNATNLVWWALPLTDGQLVVAGDVPTVPINALQLTF